MTLRDITRLDDLVDDAVQAISSATPGPEDILDHQALLHRIGEAGTQLPLLYRRSLQDPLLRTLTGIGAAGWAQVLSMDPDRERLALMGFDLTQGIVQRAEDTFGEATHAMQEVISDLFDGFLSAADRQNVEPPDHGVVPPLVKWGRPEFGPYTWPIPAVSAYDCEAGIVSMPPGFVDRGLATWSALAHEGGGHQILHADEGLHEALAQAVLDRFEAFQDGARAGDQRWAALAEYWAARVDETGSDLMGVVNMGPAAAIGVISYFRALGQVFTGEPVLSPIGRADAVHPAGLARGYVMAYGLGLCSFKEADAWQQLILEEVDRDAPAEIVLGDNIFTPEDVRLSAKLTAEAILTTRVSPLEHHSLIEIQDWRPRDQQITQTLLIHVILGNKELPSAAHHVVFAAHAVAAAVIAALITGDTAHAQKRMIHTAAQMHSTNPSWGPLGAVHPGDVSPLSCLPQFARTELGLAGFGGGESALFFGGDPIPWFFKSRSAQTGDGDDEFDRLSAEIGLGFNRKTKAWKLIEPREGAPAMISRDIKPTTLRTLLGAPAWLA